jgi:glutathione S-transferase
MDPVFHIARVDDWHAAQRRGAYTVSSLGKQLEETGFIHLSFAHQVKQVADFIYRGMTDLVLLQIDQMKLSAPLVVEADQDTTEAFPHLYGALNTDAVQAVRGYEPRADGTFEPVVIR